jgi:hypothetical protein
MTDTNPPKERDTKPIGPDQLDELADSCLVELAKLAKRRRIERALQLAKEFGPTTSDDYDDAGDEVTCCIGGRATREIPCRNSNYIGCPFRDGADKACGRIRQNSFRELARQHDRSGYRNNGGGRTRSRGYGR